MPLVIGATGERDERKRSKAGENQIFNHVSLRMAVRLACTVKKPCTSIEYREGYGAGVVVVVVFLTMTLVAIILSPSFV
jgi:hypothetical protein